LKAARDLGLTGNFNPRPNYQIHWDGAHGALHRCGTDGPRCLRRDRHRPAEHRNLQRPLSCIESVLSSLKVNVRNRDFFENSEIFVKNRKNQFFDVFEVFDFWGKFLSFSAFFTFGNLFLSDDVSCCGITTTYPLIARDGSLESRDS
jgi:hypothetical protein